MPASIAEARKENPFDGTKPKPPFSSKGTWTPAKISPTIIAFLSVLSVINNTKARPFSTNEDLSLTFVNPDFKF